MSIAAVRRVLARSTLGFLTRAPDPRGAAVVAAVGLAMLVAACESRGLVTTSPDGSTNSCANAGCAAPPLCSTGCQATCGCCTCSPGERSGNLICTANGCYEPAQVTDAGMDAVDVCSLPFEGGPCEAAIGVFAYVNGACVQRTYGGCGGNGNRFATQEECLATCAGQPGACPPNRVSREICLSCGPAGGCAERATVCALVCSPDAGSAACADSGFACYDGVCQAAFCI